MKRRSATVFLIMIILTLIPRVFIYAEKSPDNKEKIEKAVNVFRKVLEHINEDFIEKPDDIEKCGYKIINGGMKLCPGDTHSYLVGPPEQRRVAEDFDGRFSGPGFEFNLKQTNDGRQFVIISTSTYAREAGFAIGDILVGISTAAPFSEPILFEGKLKNEATDLLRGNTGTEIAIIVKRDDVFKNIIIKRVVIEIETIFDFRKVRQHLGYIAISEFGEFNKAVSELQTLDSENSKKMKALILDLRNNRGGYLDNCLDVFGLLSNNSEVPLYLIGRNGIPEPKFSNVYNRGKYADLKIVVIVNKESASGSEILAGLLKEDGAPIIGERTFGKGSVQIYYYNLPNGVGLHLTTQKYYLTKNMLAVDGKGINPTIEIKNRELKYGEEKLPEAEDIQLQKAIEVAEELIKTK